MSHYYALIESMSLLPSIIGSFHPPTLNNNNILATNEFKWPTTLLLHPFIGSLSYLLRLRSNKEQPASQWKRVKQNWARSIIWVQSSMWLWLVGSAFFVHLSTEWGIRCPVVLSNYSWRLAIQGNNGVTEFIFCWWTLACCLCWLILGASLEGGMSVGKLRPELEAFEQFFGAKLIQNWILLPKCPHLYTELTSNNKKQNLRSKAKLNVDRVIKTFR